MDLILSSILGPVCLIDAAIEEYRLVRCVKEEIRNLRTTVDMIYGVLEDAERKKVESRGTREWLKSLKQVLFDAEDALDEIATHEALERDAEDGTTRSAAVTRRLSKVRFKLIFCLCDVDHSSSSCAIAHRVKDINKKFDDISKSKDRLGLCVPDETSWSVMGTIFRRPPPDTSCLLPKEAHIIGRDDEMRKIEELLIEYSAEGTVAASSDNYNNVHVISVVGMGGVGKTTLVKHAYNSPAVTEYLPGHLKQCFTYCSLFPEDHEFDKDKLVQLWLAQQFIQIRQGFFHVESMGGEYFDDLVCMSLFEKCKYGQERFVMHDLIHNLAEFVSDCDYLRPEDNQQKGTISDTVRHVSIASDRFDPIKIEQLCNKCENMRTLLFLLGCKFQLVQLDPHHDNIFMKLRRLRVLGLSGCGISKLLASIGTLKHLRLFDLSDNPISKLPESLCKLRNLQVLKLKGCRLLGALPRNTSALVNLRHLELDTEIVSCVPGLGKLTALQELTVNESKVGELAGMGMLKELRIGGVEGVVSEEEAVHARLEAKEHLELLELKWGQSNDNRPRQHSLSEEEEVGAALKPVNRIRRLLVESYEGATSPKWMEDPSWVSTSLLVKVELRDCTKWKVLPPLSQLPGLKVLTTSGMPGVRRIGPEFFSCCCDHGGGVKLAPGFPSLEELQFEDMPVWEEWESPVVLEQQQKQHPLFLPRLYKLRLEYCEKLRELPPLPPTLTTLRLYKVGLTRLPGWMERCSDDIGRDVMPSTSSSSPSLSTLEINDCPNITSLDHGLLQRPLRMPKELSIVGCKELTSLPGGLFRHLESLEELDVIHCSKLSSLSALKSLIIEDCGELRSLRAAAGLVALEDLVIRNCPKLLHLVEKAAVMSFPSASSPVIPSTVAKISVKTLTAWSLCSPKQITTWLRQVSSLQELSIRECHQLRCFGAGDDDAGPAGLGDDDINGGSGGGPARPGPIPPHSESFRL